MVSVDELAKMKVTDLKAQLKELGLSHVGRKAELVERLSAALAKSSSPKPSLKATATAGRGQPESQPKAEAAPAAASGSNTKSKKGRKAQKEAAQQQEIASNLAAREAQSLLKLAAEPSSSASATDLSWVALDSAGRKAGVGASGEKFGWCVVSDVNAAAAAEAPKGKPIVKLGGICKSGRRWRQPQTKKASQRVQMIAGHKKTSWEKKMQIKKDRQIVQQMQKEMKDKAQALVDRRRLEVENKRKQKQANIERSIVVVPIKNMQKIKKMKKKQLRMIRKTDAANGN